MIVESRHDDTSKERTATRIKPHAFRLITGITEEFIFTQIEHVSNHQASFSVIAQLPRL